MRVFPVFLGIMGVRLVSCDGPALNVNDGLIHFVDAMDPLIAGIEGFGHDKAECSRLPAMYALAQALHRHKVDLAPILMASKTFTPEMSGLVLRDLKIARSEYKTLAMLLCGRMDIAKTCGISTDSIRHHIRTDKELSEKLLSGLIRLAVWYDRSEVERTFDYVVRLYDLVLRCYGASGLDERKPNEVASAGFEGLPHH